MRTRVILIIIMLWNSFGFVFGQQRYPNIPYRIDIKMGINNVKKLNLSLLGKELVYIPLETKPECMINVIRKVLCSNKYIFVSDYTKLFQFDRTGRFIRQVGETGNGPGEYPSIQDFCFNESRKEIYLIIVASSKLLIYNFDGVLKNSINLSFRPSQVNQIDNDKLIFHLCNVPGISQPSWIVANLKGITLLDIPNSIKRMNKPGFLVLFTPMYLFDNSIHFLEFGNDTLFYFKNKTIITYAIFSLGDLKKNPDEVVSTSINKNPGFSGLLWIKSIIENSEWLFIEVSVGISDTELHAIYNKTSGELIFLKNNMFIDDLNGGKPFWPKQIDTEALMGYSDAYDLLKPDPNSLMKMEDEKLVTLKKSLNEVSNPIIMILK